MSIGNWYYIIINEKAGGNIKKEGLLVESVCLELIMYSQFGTS